MSRRSIPVWIILISYWGLLFYLTHRPGLVITLRGGDKVAHYLAYGMLGGLLYLALWSEKPHSRELAFKILVIGMCYGALDEWTQALPWFNRSCDFLDWCADCAGLGTAAVGMTMIHRGWQLIHASEPPARQRETHLHEAIDTSKT
ncbi:MAG TPA: VanZ family protein [Tepidisphaeraceae bacterium]|jgi:hypothetical protein